MLAAFSSISLSQESASKSAAVSGCPANIRSGLSVHGPVFCPLLNRTVNFSVWIRLEMLKKVSLNGLILTKHIFFLEPTEAPGVLQAGMCPKDAPDRVDNHTRRDEARHDEQQLRSISSESSLVTSDSSEASSQDMPREDEIDDSEFFEGAEKLLEVWFTSKSSEKKPGDLRRIPR